ncbi:MAG: RNA polymerase sigma-70 factor [Tannerella sp.]|jgi:RNA polymerase sigma-70 factor (ECF subfamily)|nr:RNA polymerase sigma-70 factor [Tannerella sp.]
MKIRQPDIEKDEYGKIYVAYFSRLVRFSQTYVMSRCEAENIVQDVFLYLWENKTTFAAFGNINAYLFTMVKNRCIDFLRNQLKTSGRNIALSDIREKELELKLYSLQEFNERALSNVEIETIIRKAIDSLPERCREIFVLSRLQGLRHKEIAERLAITPHTVERQIQIALKKLRVVLKDYAPLLVFII